MCFVSSGRCRLRPGKARQGPLRSLSHGRHDASSMARRGIGSGEVGSGVSRSVDAWRVAVSHGNHSLGQQACGCERRGVGWIVAWRSASRLVGFGLVKASHGNHLHGRRGRGFDAARWDVLRPVVASRVTSWHGEVFYHHRVGTEADQRGRGGMAKVRQGSAGRGQVWRVKATNHHAVGAVPASTPVGGMHRSWCGGLSLVLASHCRAM
jgi:hypothetical protein